ncbi:hypothetical protein V494_01601 [Pseudogymnoascus sp. VKM F-4513 (FW-928)]|nr:hypothetical protein V494_01601 [Pseudogymnoascus sp. VKM F-4513 (FW-928)]
MKSTLQGPAANHIEETPYSADHGVLQSLKNRLLRSKDKEKENETQIASGLVPAPPTSPPRLTDTNLLRGRISSISDDTTLVTTVTSSTLLLPKPLDHRSNSTASNLSTFDLSPTRLGPGALSHARKRSTDRRLDPLGITVLHSPVNTPTANVIFVHGLGGTSQHTWARNRDLELFWPKKWLPQEPVISSARILTYGYNANFMAAGPGSIASISDFAQSLLFEMKFGKDKEVESLNLDQAPIIFVVHSMGGLVFKKAFIMGINSSEYKDVVSSIRAVVFISTPHRGTGLAEMLNRILSASVFNHTPKQYINELRENSPTLEEINESFRHHAPSLRIFSFYETLRTPVGIKTAMILTKASSTLGYPGEIIDPIDADHHNVCKFASPNDVSYKKIRAVLHTLISPYSDANSKLNMEDATEEMRHISDMLGISSAPEDDFASLLYVCKEGTCESILSEPLFEDWRHNPEGPQILWLNAAPGSGKSVKMAFLINYLQQRDTLCSYFFFKNGDSTKRSVGSLLRSLAWQIAEKVPSFRKAFILFDNNGLKVDKMEARMIWEKLFVNCLFKLELTETLYWAIDAWDESDSFKVFSSFLHKISASKVSIRIIISSRRLPEIATAFDKISSKTTVKELSISDNRDDIKQFAEQEMEEMYADDEFKTEIINEIVKRSEGNFLWVSLVLKEVMPRVIEEDIRKVLDDIPPGMEALYQRMEAGIRSHKSQAELSLARMILAWATYSRKPLKSDELLEALKSESSSITDIRHAASQLCGHFVMVDTSDRIVLVHQTARDYLINTADLPFPFSTQEIQEELFTKLITTLSDSRQRSRGKKQGPSALHSYAVVSWPYHLHRSGSSSTSSLNLLVKFFQGFSVLSWIQALASLKSLKVLITGSTTLNFYISRRKAYESGINPSQHRIKDICLLEGWAIDLLKIVGKFGTNLIEDPTSIIKYIPQLCPQDTTIYRQFGKQAELRVSGVSDPNWDDSLAKVSVGSGIQALKVVSSNLYIAASTSNKTVVLWDAITFEEFRILHYGEHIFAMCFTESGLLLATYGHENTVIWNVRTGQQVHRIKNHPECRALAIKFVQDDSKLIAGLNTRKVVEVLIDGQTEWTTIEEDFLVEDPSTFDGAFINSPTAMAFTSDGSHAVVAYRAFPLTLWDIEERQRVTRCERSWKDGRMSWTGVTKVIWHPNDEDVLGIYWDGIVFKWNPFDDTHQELPSETNTAPSEIRCSPNGTIFATSDVNGTVKLYNHQYFSLVYQLLSEDIITGLCFSPDSRRFFDLRGSYCKVWEPNALVRLLDQDEQDTEAGSTVGSNQPSEAFTSSPNPITTLAMRPQKDIVCIGNSEGLVEMCDVSTHERIDTDNSSADMSIDWITWAEDGMHFAYSDGAVITVKKISGRRMSQWNFTTIMDIDMDDSGMIQQILLDEDRLLVVLKTSAQLWSMGSLKTTVFFEEGRKWVCHPHDKKSLLALTLDTVTKYTWQDLQICEQWHISACPTSPDTHVPILRKSFLWSITEPVKYLDEVIVSDSRKFLLLLISRDGAARKRWDRLVVIPTAFNGGDICPIDIPASIASSIEKPLGMLVGERLVEETFLPAEGLGKYRGVGAVSVARGGEHPVPAKGRHSCCKGGDVVKGLQ